MIQSKSVSLSFTQTIYGSFKFLLFVIMICSFLIFQIFTFILIHPQKVRLKLASRVVSFFSKIGLTLLSVKVEHLSASLPKTGTLIVANHQSYLDVLVLAAYYPSLFVTSVEIKETFFLGQITQLAGCFFVERRKSKIKVGTKEREASQMKKVIHEGTHVILFPEGTSSDGNQVLAFKATFFQVSVDCQCPVIPMVIKYQGLSKDSVPWYGDMTFSDHLFRLCLMPEISASLNVLPSLRGENKFELANQSQSLIKSFYEKN